MDNQPVNFINEISDYIFTSKYSRYDEKLERRETWHESVKRLENMHLKKYSFLQEEDIKKIKWAFDLVRDKRVLPSMRSMQYGGKAIEAHNARMFNCSTRHIDSLRSFAEIFYLLLCGCGVDIGLSKMFLDRLPNLVDGTDKTGTVLTYVVEDDIEGWADSVEALLLCYFKNTPYTGRKIVFDYSRIRKKGEPLKTGGGKAPGYKGLKNAHSKIKELLDHIIEYHRQVRLKSINAYDIIMHCADAVLSGGSRRAATSTTFDKSDIEMINSKTSIVVDKVFAFSKAESQIIGGKEVEFFEGRVQFEGKRYDVKIEAWELENLNKNSLISWRHLFPHRARSNNSVLLIRNEISEKEFQEIAQKTKEFGEPGYIFGNDKKQLYNPCREISFIPVTDQGVCGVQFCNLTTQNGGKIKTKQDWKECVESAVIIGTLQAGYTNFPYLSNTAKQLTEEEALLGVSITGIMDNPELLLNPELQKEMSDFAKSVNLEWSKKIGINPSARICCIKPEGTSSLVLGTSSGIHPHHSKRYFRRVQSNKIDNVYKHFKKTNPSLCEQSVWSANNTDDVITFPIRIPDSAVTKDKLSAIQHLEIIKNTQINWVANGTTQFNKKPITHNVSCTVIVKNDEWSDVISYLYKNREHFAAVSLLGEFGDKDYPQAPMEAIVNQEDEEKWNKIVSSFKHVDYKQLKESQDQTTLIQEGSCYGGACSLV